MEQLAAAALLSLGTASWWTRHDRGSAASRGLMGGLLIYNAAVVALVLSATFGSLGPPLWALVVLARSHGHLVRVVVTGRPVSAHVWPLEPGP
jgi:hypothetical protein